MLVAHCVKEGWSDTERVCSGDGDACIEKGLKLFGMLEADESRGKGKGKGGGQGS